MFVYGLGFAVGGCVYCLTRFGYCSLVFLNFDLGYLLWSGLLMFVYVGLSCCLFDFVVDWFDVCGLLCLF